MHRSQQKNQQKNRLLLIGFISLIFITSNCLLVYANGGEWGDSWSIGNFLQATTFEQLITGIAYWVRTLAVVVGMIVLIWAGVLFMTAGGDEQKITTAKKAFFWAIIGIVVALLASSWITIIKELTAGASTAQGVVNALDRIANWFFAFVVVLAVIMIIWSGLLFMTAGGDEKKISTAKRALTWALVGVAIAIASKGLIYLIGNFLGA